MRKDKLEPYSCWIQSCVLARNDEEAKERARLMMMGECRETIAKGDLRPDFKMVQVMPNSALGEKYEALFAGPPYIDKGDYEKYARIGKW